MFLWNNGANSLVVLLQNRKLFLDTSWMSVLSCVPGNNGSVQIQVDPAHPRHLPEIRFLGADHGQCIISSHFLSGWMFGQSVCVITRNFGDVMETFSSRSFRFFAVSSAEALLAQNSRFIWTASTCRALCVPVVPNFCMILCWSFWRRRRRTTDPLHFLLGTNPSCVACADQGTRLPTALPRDRDAHTWSVSHCSYRAFEAQNEWQRSPVVRPLLCFQTL